MRNESIELLKLLNRVRLAHRNIDQTMINLAKTMPPIEEVENDTDRMVQVLMGSLELMESAALDYAEATKDAREYARDSLRRMGREDV